MLAWLAATPFVLVTTAAAFAQAAPVPAPGRASGSSGEAAAPSPMRIVSFNIRYDTPKDEQRSWRFRSDRLIEHVAAMNADFIGFQEVLPSQRSDLAAGLPGYGSIGRSRERSSTEGEATPIFYDRGRWAPIESRGGTFWLSETPGEPGSRSWKSACPRIATWGVFRELATGRRVFVLNTHLDHESQEARDGGARVIAEFLAQEAGDLPVIVMGDFNAAPTNPARRTLCEGVDGSPRLTDTYEAVHPGVERNAGTFHGFRGGAAGARIDAILVSDAFDVAGATIDRTGEEGAYFSDHWPVTAELRRREAPATRSATGSGSGASGTPPGGSGSASPDDGAGSTKPPPERPPPEPPPHGSEPGAR